MKKRKTGEVFGFFKLKVLGAVVGCELNNVGVGMEEEYVGEGGNGVGFG